MDIAHSNLRMFMHRSKISKGYVSACVNITMHQEQHYKFTESEKRACLDDSTDVQMLKEDNGSHVEMVLRTSVTTPHCFDCNVVQTHCCV